MSDSQKHLEDQSRTTALGEWLMRRATEPLGVIDVSYAQRKYFRLAHWLARRTALLDHITSRYGVEGAFTNSAYPLTVQHPPGQPVNVFSTAIQSLSPGRDVVDAARRDSLDRQPRDARPSSLAEIIAERSIIRAGEHEASAEGKFRISRRPAPMPPTSDAVSTPITSLGLPDLALRKGAAEISDVQKAGAVKSKSAEENQPFAPRDYSSSPRWSDPDAPGELSSTAANLQHARDDRVAMTPIANQGPNDLVFRKTDVEASAVETANAIQPDHRVPAKIQSAGEPPLRTPPLVRPLSDTLDAEPRLSSRSGTTARPPPIEGEMAQELKHGHPPSMGDRGEVVSPETREDSLNASMPRIVWRNQEVSSQIADYVAKELRASAITDPAQSTQGSSALKPTAGRGEQNGAESMPVRRGDEVRIEHISPQVIRTISERVIRAINLDLKLERERRGVSKWR